MSSRAAPTTRSTKRRQPPELSIPCLVHEVEHEHPREGRLVREEEEVRQACEPNARSTSKGFSQDGAHPWKRTHPPRISYVLFSAVWTPLEVTEGFVERPAEIYDEIYRVRVSILHGIARRSSATQSTSSLLLRRVQRLRFVRGDDALPDRRRAHRYPTRATR